MDSTVFNKPIDELTKWLSIKFYGESEEKQKSIIDEITQNTTSSKEISNTVRNCVIKYFTSLVEDTEEVDVSVLQGFSLLACALPSLKYHDIMMKYIEQSIPVFMNYDHPLKSCFKYFLQALAKNSKRDQRTEELWKTLWHGDFDHWHDAALVGMQRQSAKLIVAELPTIYKRYTYNAEKALKPLWNDTRFIEICTAALKKGMDAKEYWAERLCFSIHNYILDTEEKEEFCQKTGYKTYSSSYVYR